MRGQLRRFKRPLRRALSGAISPSDRLGTLEAVRQTWLSKRAFGLHAMWVFLVVACGALGWWQYSRAVSGNELSWVYTFEWPFFAVYGTYMWWKLLHETVSERKARRQTEPAEALATGGAAVAAADGTALASEVGEEGDPVGFDPYDESDPELAAYNRYLASLHTAPRRRRSSRHAS